jgi:hypothetical protein
MNSPQVYKTGTRRKAQGNRCKDSLCEMCRISAVRRIVLGHFLLESNPDKIILKILLILSKK